MKQALSEVSDNKPVLLETFARDSKGKIVFDDKMISPDGTALMPKVHTVLLYKVPGEGNNEVLILDQVIQTIQSILY